MEGAPKYYKHLIALADIANAWRIFPRLFIGTYIYLLYESVTWFMELDAPSVEQAGLISIIIGTGAAWFGLYANTGKSNPTLKDQD